MRKLYAFLFIMLFVGVVNAATYTTLATGSGNYTDNGSWLGGVAPPTTFLVGNNIVIQAGFALTINTTVSLYGDMLNNGEIVLSSGLYVRAGATLTQSGTCSGTYSQFRVLSGGTLDITTNGCVIPSATVFSTGSTLLFSGITTTGPSITSGDSFGNIVINCPAQTANIEIPQISVGNSITVTNSNTGYLLFKSSATATTIAGDLSIGTNGKVAFEPGSKVTVNGTLSNAAGVSGLLMQSSSISTPTGSLIADQNVSGKVQRFIPANRWYMFGAATTGSTSNLVNGAYLQYYTEATDAWTYVTATDYNLQEGLGYAYYGTTDKTITFSGTLYNGDKTFTNLSKTGLGWHVLSNPYNCAVEWNTTDWNLSGSVVGTAKYYNGTNWTDRAAGSILAANQGFAIQVTSGTNSLTIPKAAKTHSSQNFLKSNTEIGSNLIFSLYDEDDKTNDLLYVRFLNDATVGYDIQYDSHELYGLPSAADIFVMENEEEFSTIALPPISEALVLPLGLKIGDASNITIKLDAVDYPEKLEIALEDMVNNTIFNIVEGEQYNFSASNSDNKHRFNLHIRTANKIEEINNSNFNIWNSNGILYISNEKGLDFSYFIYDVNGRLLLSEESMSNVMNRIPLNLSHSAFFVKVISNNSVLSKSFIN